MTAQLIRLPARPLLVPDIETNGDAYAVIDVESTGLDTENDRVLSLGVVHTDATGRITDTWYTLVNPGPDVEINNSHIHGITHETLAGAPTFAQIVPALRARLTGRTIAAHNAPFDTALIAAEHARVHATPPNNRVVCTLKAARKAFHGSHKLTDCCTHYGIRLAHAHHALHDAIATAEVLGRLISDGHRPA